MPLYEYECPKDGLFALVRKFPDPPLSACPSCGGPVEKLLSAPAIQFKGTGWYITDYARKGAGGESASGKADGQGETTSSAEKPATAVTPATPSARQRVKKRNRVRPDRICLWKCRPYRSAWWVARLLLAPGRGMQRV